MKSLVIAEKPSVGRDIARVLGCSKAVDGVLEGNKYIVAWALGHLVELASPEEYVKKLEKEDASETELKKKNNSAQWKMEELPIMPEKMKLVVMKQTAKQYQVIKKQLNRSDVNQVIIATDAGREGELVARWILEKANSQKPVKRLWISSVTDKAIRDGFSSLRDGREYLPLYAAAQARAEADWLVGINGTRALTCKYNAQLSCGRVQTPTLAMIAKREQEISSFVPQEYYGVVLNAEGIRFTWQEEASKGFRTFQMERAQAVLEEMKGKKLTLVQVERRQKKSFAPGLYDLTTLQREANQHFGYSAKMTLDIMQRLYENYKVLTYPRTDSKYIGKDIVPTLKERLRACSVGPYKKLAGSLLMAPIQTNSSFVDDKKVSDHHAIIPTEQFVDLSHMTVDERRIYDMVVRRFLSVLYPPCEYEQVTYTAKCAGYIFLAKGSVIKNLGYKVVFEQESNEADEEGDEKEAALKEQTLPDKQQGASLTILKAELTKGKTKPPAHFTEATLLGAMENPIKYMESRDSKMLKTLGETGGLGTVATRADIIEKLFHSFLIEKKDNSIYLTAKGRQLLELVPEDLKKPELTASWEMTLEEISKGKKDSSRFLSDIRDYTVEIVEEIKGGEKQYRHENRTSKKCPQCGSFLLSVNGKNSKLLVCENRDCGYKETISRTTNARCPQCH
ncbi:MAG: DNA topoisomerase III, partial [Lachnospiraceae bacterium]